MERRKLIVGGVQLAAMLFLPFVVNNTHTDNVEATHRFVVWQMQAVIFSLAVSDAAAEGLKTICKENPIAYFVRIFTSIISWPWPLWRQAYMVCVLTLAILVVLIRLLSLLRKQKSAMFIGA